MNAVYQTLIDLSIRTGVFTRWYFSEDKTVFTNKKGVTISYQTPAENHVNPETVVVSGKGITPIEFPASEVREAFNKATVLSA